jgi:hypothetical protein
VARKWPVKDWWIVLWALEKYHGKSSGLPAYPIPSAIHKTWADCCRLCGRELEIGETCACKPPYQFHFKDELNVLLLNTNYGEEYRLAILFRFHYDHDLPVLAKEFGISYGKLRQRCASIKRTLGL